MMRHLGVILATLAFASSSLPCLAQYGGMMGGGYGGMGGIRRSSQFFQVETVGDNRVTGALKMSSLKIKSPELGELEVKMPAVRSVTFGEGDNGDTIVTVSGATIKGKVEAEEFQVRSEFGPLTLKRSQLKSLQSWASLSQQGGRFIPFPQIDPEPDPAAEAPEPERPARPSPIPRSLLHPSR